jgi:hypothetical protein
MTTSKTSTNANQESDKGLHMTNDTSPKVLVVVSGGIACAYAEPGVRVAIADLDNLAIVHDEEQTIVHDDFRHLLASANVIYPTSSNAPANQAEVVSGT